MINLQNAKMKGVNNSVAIKKNLLTNSQQSMPMIHESSKSGSRGQTDKNNIAAKKSSGRSGLAINSKQMSSIVHTDN